MSKSLLFMDITNEQWKQSGLSQKKFCEQNSIAYHHFHYWYKRHRTRQASDSGGEFVPITVNAAPLQCSIELQLPDGKKVSFYQPIAVDYL
jgi:hypothetical protein